MNSAAPDLKSVFGQAAEIASPAERSAYLDEACGNDADLRAQIDGLLAAAEKAGSFMRGPAVAHSETERFPPVTERPGTVIGPYKLLQQIGEGGMGVVFMAEQTEPLQRKVALKVIKPGMDTRQVIARFEAERQALAMMDHVNIARVLDAGTTESGRPYFVMELVHGVPITKYCDDNHLTPRERLELFVPVCQAIQHAHQKGVIHRDVKPSNVMITLYDGKPVPKVIDFGVAKATEQKLTERTLFTQYGTIVGTLEYMSPEQAEISALGADTRSDIYSLGVLLYELLAGSTPFEGKRLKEAAFDEMLRIMREEEPPKPSTRLSTTDQLPSIAANRSLEPLKLNRLVQGELDWIVMKALEKDRNRRYETASGFAADIERHLRDEPVEAGPPSTSYRFRKFARRNKVALATAITVSLAVLVAVGSIGWAARDRAAREEQLALERTARQAKVSGQLELILDEVARLEQSEKWSEALVSARRAEPMLAAGEAPPDIQERVRQVLADLQLVRRLDEIRAQSGTAWGKMHLATQADQEYTAAFRQAGIDLDALPASEAVHRITARRPIAAAVVPALDDWVAVRSMRKGVEVRSMDRDEAATRRLIDVLHAADPDPWRQRVRDVLARKDWPALDNLVTSADLDRQPAATLSFISAALWASGEDREQELILRRAQWKYPADYWINHRLGANLIWRESPNDIRDGIGFMRAAVALRPESALSLMNLGSGYSHLGQYDQAIDCYRKAIELAPNSSASYTCLGNALRAQGLDEEAIAAYEQAIKLAPQNDSLPNNNMAWLLANSADVKRRDPDKAVRIAKRLVEQFPNNSNYWNTLGVAKYGAGDWNGAIDALKKSEELPPQRFTNCVNALFLAMAHWQLGEQDEARRWYGKAVEWMEKEQTDDEQIRRFRSEAEELLKITDE